MKITMAGVGYVGLVSGACLAEMGNDVLCVDVDAAKIAGLMKGDIPLYEPGLKGLVHRNARAGRLHFTSDIVASVHHGDVQFIAVGTPPGPDGSADLRCVWDVARNIGRHMLSHKIIVDKSTVPVGTADQVRKIVAEMLAQRGVEIPFSVASNPEFLKEGAGIRDFMSPDRVIVGADDEETITVLRRLYEPFQRTHPRLMVMDVRSAELTKYAANAMLATRISFMNEMANLAETLGADIEHVRNGIGADPRIGYQFLYPGIGYGGSCFPKDAQALIHIAEAHALPMHILRAVEKVNVSQKFRLSQKIVQRYGENLEGRTFALWGLAFKPNTDDMRLAPSLTIIEELRRRGARLRIYDPMVRQDAVARLTDDDQVKGVKDMYQALKGVDGLLLVTEWKVFRAPDFEQMHRLMKVPYILDGRNQYNPTYLGEMGFEYEGIGRL
jgi:UDPglucose 6-dehydrogenase